MSLAEAPIMPDGACQLCWDTEELDRRATHQVNGDLLVCASCAALEAFEDDEIVPLKKKRDHKTLGDLADLTEQDHADRPMRPDPLQRVELVVIDQSGAPVVVGTFRRHYAESLLAGYTVSWPMDSWQRPFVRPIEERCAVKGCTSGPARIPSNLPLLCPDHFSRLPRDLADRVRFCGYRPGVSARRTERLLMDIGASLGMKR